MSITNESRNLLVNLQQTRKAILGRGGTLTATAGMKDFPNAIFNIPADASLAYYTDDTTAYKKTVPSGAEEYAQIKSVGGMTRVEYSPNFLEGAGVNGWKYGGESGYDTSFYIAGIDGGKFRFDIINKPAHCTCDIIYYRQDDTLGSYEIGEVIDAPSLYEAAGYYIYISVHGLENGEVIYPMFYRLPDNNEEYRITEYTPCGAQKLVPTAVTEIVSKGANLIPFPYRDKTMTKYGLTLTANNDGSISVKGKKEADSNTIFFYLVYEGMNYRQPINVGTYSFSLNSPISTNQIWLNLGVTGVGSFNAYNKESTKVNIPNNTTYYLVLKISNYTEEIDATFYPMLNVGETAAPYHPYTTEPIDTIDIPEAVRNLEGYGQDNTYIDFERRVFVNGDAETDISAYITASYIKVEGGGELVFENIDKADVPSSVKYVRRI